MQAANHLAESGAAEFRLSVHLLVGVAVGFISPFTGLAWPFALLTGVLLGSADASRMRGEPVSSANAFSSGLLVTFGVLAMLFFGALIGGIIAFAVVALASFSERAAALASPTDRGVARILVFIVPIVMWLVVFPVLGLNVNVQIGS